MRQFVKIVLLATIVGITGSSAFAQKNTFDGKKIKETKEWKVEGKKKRLDHKTTYNADGKKVEE
ncbi:MAG: hypothetical protein J6Q59_05495, partial [Paludibacteraceae bacterium]|nr:hypothetical protein [Paludibacteraceae bacterium]